MLASATFVATSCKLGAMTTAWLTTSEMRAWRNFIDSVSTLTAALENDLAPHDLTMGDYEVLVRLSEAEDERLRMCDLAAALQLSPSGLTRRLDGLVGTVWSSASPSNGPSGDVRPLTPSGGPSSSRPHPTTSPACATASSRASPATRSTSSATSSRPCAPNLRDLPVVTAAPLGFRAHVANIGIKDTTDDFVVVASDAPSVAVGRVHPSSFRRAERDRQPRATCRRRPREPLS